MFEKIIRLLTTNTDKKSDAEDLRRSFLFSILIYPSLMFGSI